MVLILCSTQPRGSFLMQPVSQPWICTRRHPHHDRRRTSMESSNQGKYRESPHMWCRFCTYISFSCERWSHLFVMLYPTTPSYFIVRDHHTSQVRSSSIFAIDSSISFWSRYPDQGLGRRWGRWAGRMSVFFCAFLVGFLWWMEYH